MSSVEPTKGKTLLVLYSGSVFLEVSAALSIAKERTALIVASPDGNAVKPTEGFTVQADYSFADTDLVGVTTVLVPGGDCYDVFENPELKHLLNVAYEQGAIVAGICNGALLLAKAGLLAGRRCTHTCTPKYAPVPQFQELLDAATPLFSSSTFVDENVVVDGRIVTAKPWAFLDFGLAVSALTGMLTPDEAKRQRRYYMRGMSES